MGKVSAGGRAGLFAGLVYAVLEAAVVVTLLIVFKGQVVKVIGSKLPSGTGANAVYNSLIVTDAAVGIVFGIAAGVVLGLAFGAIADRIPGRTALTKGLVFGLVLWLLLHVVADYFGNWRYGATFYAVDIGLGLATSLVYGALLGMFFDREMRKVAHSAEAVPA